MKDPPKHVIHNVFFHCSSFIFCIYTIADSLLFSIIDMSVLIPTFFESVILGQVEKNLCLKFRLCASLKKIWDEMEKDLKEVIKAMEKNFVCFCIKISTLCKIIFFPFYIAFQSAENDTTSFVLPNRIIFSNTILMLSMSSSYKNKQRKC